MERLHTCRPFSTAIRLKSFPAFIKALSSICARASSAVAVITVSGAAARYFPSTRAISGKILCGIEPLVSLSCRVSTETPVTSDPVPQVVGTAITGRASEESDASYRRSAPQSRCFIIKAMALAASMGEPPPIPITKSAFSASPYSLAFITVSTEGFSSTSGKTHHSVPFC